MIAVWFAGLRLDSVRIAVAKVDSLDVTDAILKLLFKARTDLMFLSGVSFAGFNVVDCKRLYDTLRIPVIVVSREKPNNASVKRALRKHFADWKTRWRFVQELGTIHAYTPQPEEQPLYFEALGISATKVRQIIRAYCVTSRVPEPVRVAGIMAKGLALAGRDLGSY
jgi:endonuclease V-like protein UPF0215 family